MGFGSLQLKVELRLLLSKTFGILKNSSNLDYTPGEFTFYDTEKSRSIIS